MILACFFWIFPLAVLAHFIVESFFLFCLCQYMAVFCLNYPTMQQAIISQGNFRYSFICTYIQCFFVYHSSYLYACTIFVISLRMNIKILFWISIYILTVKLCLIEIFMYSLYEFRWSQYTKWILNGECLILIICNKKYKSLPGKELPN